MKKTIKVTVDKSHLLTLGERMYSASIELIRELVSNAYDADATEVYVTINPETIVVEDNGSGMNEKGLAQFFTIGSEEKRRHSLSPRFGRKRIGQFGIGKFSALAAADCFTVETRKGSWVYSVVFDKEEWQKGESWELPIKREPATPLHHEGTKVVLSRLKKSLNLLEVERYLREAIPLRAKHFTIFLNNKRLTPRFIAGRRLTIKQPTMYGLIEGEIVVAINPKEISQPGIECRVKQVLVRREFFGLEKQFGHFLSRLAGEVNVDFLPVLSSRADFVRDSPEYKLFEQIMTNRLSELIKDLKKEAESKQLEKISAELKQVLAQIRQALTLNPDLTPSGRVLVKRRKTKKESLVGMTITEPRTKREVEVPGEVPEKPEGEAVSPKEPKPKKELPKPAVIKKIRLKKLGISVGIVSLGEDEPEALSEGNLIYINQDHPLYQKLSAKREQLSLHLLRLITQEVVLMKKTRLSAGEAFSWQSKLMTDAMAERGL